MQVLFCIDISINDHLQLTVTELIDLINFFGIANRMKHEVRVAVY